MKVTHNLIKEILFSFGFGFALLLAVSHTRGHASATAQLPLNHRTLNEARELRMALRNPLNAVKQSERQLRELSRIPDPASLTSFREVLLHPLDYAAPVRKVAAEALSEYRGASNETEQRLILEALDQEKVREVVTELQHTLQAMNAKQPRYEAQPFASLRIARQAPGRAKILE